VMWKLIFDLAKVAAWAY